MSKNGGNFLSLLIGTALGVSAGLYLNSQNGKKLRKKVLKRLDEMETTIEDKVTRAYNDLKGQVRHTASKVQSTSDNVNDKIKEASGKVKEAASKN